MTCVNVAGTGAVWLGSYWALLAKWGKVANGSDRVKYPEGHLRRPAATVGALAKCSRFCGYHPYVAQAVWRYRVTEDSHNGAEALPVLPDGELSPELVLVDPDIAELARNALPDVTPTEIRLSVSLKLQMPAAAEPPPPAAAVVVAEPPPPTVAEAAATSPTAARLARTPDVPPPPAYEDVRRVFHEPRIDLRRHRHSMRPALLILAVAAGVALALPRALDGPSSKTSAARRTALTGTPAHHRSKAKARAKPKAKVKPKAHKQPAAKPARHTRPAHKAKAAPKKHALAPPAARHVSKPKPKRHAVRPHVRMLPDFVWVPVKNARGYLVEFLAGSKVALRARTRAARLRLSVKQLRPGRYRWVVWQTGASGAPIGKPLVDSRVRVR